jgi:hypothetical protein
MATLDADSSYSFACSAAIDSGIDIARRKSPLAWKPRPPLRSRWPPSAFNQPSPGSLFRLWSFYGISRESAVL